MPKKNHAPSRTLPNRIRQLRRERNLTQEELGARMGSTPTASTVGKYERGELSISLDLLLEIAEALEVSPGEILPGGGPAGVRLLPVAGQISAGDWREAVALSDEVHAVPDHLRGLNLFVLRADGDSMDMLVREGGFIMVDPDQRELIDKKYYVVMNGDSETTFKQFCADPLQLSPCSSNPRHKPITIGAEPFTVLGRVVHVSQDV